ncbi:ubiquinol-cytochrome c reductase iron-sulfur subunit [Kineococcus xinjiangensis]|uniref:Cytochrome bc1 complex Rieske iron-sulfur subunit n=1 Tax=Kineococcus xinjiangensis TaxID=512762 RepID=A0A2S6IM72_9ACTN|nr:Rieske 2Fe-2S domain-containing protein [Kineococcus xinjiangensis]PPK95298.1 ubiquinol-cytochrome c reductase iron-sulfur subunit [Kineococcus xinjiangensis]
MTQQIQPAEQPPNPAHGSSTAVSSVSEANSAERFTDPGLPPHRHRLVDVDPRAAKRAERQVATLFILSMIGTLGTLAAIIGIEYEGHNEYFDRLAAVSLSTKAIGFALFVSLFCLGVGAVHWAKTLMPDEERVDYRHRQRGTDAERARAVAILKDGVAETGLGRRPLIRNTLIGAAALLPLSALFFFRDTGPLPGTALEQTWWDEGEYLIKDPEGGRILAADVQLGSIVHVMPETIEEAGHDLLAEKGKAAVILLRLKPEELNPPAGREDWAVDGIVAYSKICTHMGCPVALYEQTTHHLLCPCHQSTFDVTQDCKVIFGPAKRPLPQLPIMVDEDGYLVARAGFQEPVGPSFWERG